MFRRDPLVTINLLVTFYRSVPFEDRERIFNRFGMETLEAIDDEIQVVQFSRGPTPLAVRSTLTRLEEIKDAKLFIYRAEPGHA